MYKLNDEVIGQVAKLVQIAILAGTDIVDNLRTLELVEEDNELFLSPEYKVNFENNLNTMMEDLNSSSKQDPTKDDTKFLDFSFNKS